MEPKITLGNFQRLSCPGLFFQQHCAPLCKIMSNQLAQELTYYSNFQNLYYAATTQTHENVLKPLTSHSKNWCWAFGAKIDEMEVLPSFSLSVIDLLKQN